MNESEARLTSLAGARLQLAERLREQLGNRNEQLEDARRKIRELADRNDALIAAHAVEAEASEALLGAAMDAALQRGRT